MTDAEAMAIALAEAALARTMTTFPSEPSSSSDAQVIAQRHNERELRKDPTAHAEILALRDAAEMLGTWHLDGRHARRHARAVRHVRGGRSAGPGRASRLRRRSIRRLAHAALSTTCAPIRALTTRSRSSAAWSAEACWDPAAGLLQKPPRHPRLTSRPEGCESGRIGRSRKPLCPRGHRGFESHSLRPNGLYPIHWTTS